MKRLKFSPSIGLTASPRRGRRAPPDGMRPGSHTLEQRCERVQARNWRRFQLFLGDDWLRIVELAIASVIAAISESTVLALVAQMAAALVAKTTSIDLNVGPIRLTVPLRDVLVIAFGMAILRIALQWGLSYLPAAIGADVQASLRSRLFSAFSRAPWSVQSSDAAGEFQELASTHVLQAAWGILQACTVITSGFMVVVLVASALVVSPIVASIVIGIMLGLMAALRPLNGIGSRQAKAFSDAQVELASGINEAVDLAQEIHIFGAAAAQELLVSRLIGATTRRYFATQFLVRIVPGVYQAIVLLLLVGGLAVLYLSGLGHLSALGAVVLLLIRASNYGQGAQGAYHSLHQQLPFLERILDAEARYRSTWTTYGHHILSGVPSIRFRNVCYRYVPGPPVINELSFEVSAGEAVGVVGPSGAGKSTLVQLLLGLRIPDSGEYLLADEIASSLSAAVWTDTFAYMPQEPRLLHGTVGDNIRFFRQLDDEAVERAARMARIHDDIIRLPNGYETVVGRRVDAVSGGQCQRICLARALVAEPRVLVLDEPTSALDPSSESLIQESLEVLRGSVTMFIVAHRMSTLNVCDRVMILSNGRLEAFERPQELLRSSEYYRTAAALSASGVSVPS